MSTIPKRLILTALFVLCGVCAWPQDPQNGDAAAFSPNPVEPEMIFVTGGTFTMGCTSEQGSDCWESEEPAHQVTLSGFYIGKYEINQAQWKAVMGADNNPSRFVGDDLPVENVNWNDVQEFIKRLNAQTGKIWRLPTEAEWEYAARGGNQSWRYKYSGSGNVDEVAWHMDNSGDRTHPVGTKVANELGIYDMSGNVWEWVNDLFGSYSDSPRVDPQGSASGSFRVVRGGSWGRYAQLARVTARYSFNPGDRGGTLGFRLARSSDKP